MSYVPRITVERLIELGSGYSSIGVADLLGDRRQLHLARVRFAISYVANRAGWSLPNIGDVLGGRHHTTIMHSVQRAKYMLSRDDEPFIKLVKSLTEHARAVERGVPEPAITWRQAPPKNIPPKPKCATEIDYTAHRKPKNELSPDDDDAMMRLRGSRKLIAAIRREHPERCLAA
jgi:hypothetical protein